MTTPGTMARIAAANERSAVLFLAERSPLAGLICRALLDDGAGDELVPHAETTPGHDIDMRGGL